MRPPQGGDRIADGTFLAGVVVASAVLYVGRLGFYSDDWAFLSVLQLASDQSLSGLVGEQLGLNENLRMRPTQVVYQALLYRLFGLDPLGYHLVNIAVLVAVAVALYLVLLRVGLPRVVALAVPAVYALLPNYSTNRFWFAAFGYLLSLGLWLLAVHADLRAVESRRLWAWKALAGAALLAAALGYEIVLPLAVLNIVAVEVHARRVHPGGLAARVGTAGRVVFHGVTVATIVGVALYKAWVAEGVGIQTSAVFHVARVGTGAVLTDFGTYGVGLPHTVWWAAPTAGITGGLVAVLVGVAVYVYLVSVTGRQPTGWPAAAWGRMAAAGVGVYVLGYAIFATTGRVQFSSTGTANRVAAGAAIGVAVIVVSVAGWAVARLLRDRVQILAAAVAVVCAAGVVVNNGIASYWVESWYVQQHIAAGIETSLPDLAPDSSLLLAGVCPYAGPAPVFESHWDLAGALQVAYRDPSLAADVVTSRMSLEASGVRTRIYDTQVAYPYSDRLLMHDARRLRTVALSDEATARREITAVTDSGCHAGRPGLGSMRLPFDRLRGKLEARIIHPLLGDT